MSINSYKYDINDGEKKTWGRTLFQTFIGVCGLTICLLPISKQLTQEDYKKKKNKGRILETYLPTLVCILYIWNGLNNVKSTYKKN